MAQPTRCPTHQEVGRLEWLEDLPDGQIILGCEQGCQLAYDAPNDQLALLCEDGQVVGVNEWPSECKTCNGEGSIPWYLDGFNKVLDEPRMIRCRTCSGRGWVNEKKEV